MEPETGAKGTSLEIQRLRFHVSNVRGASSIPGRGTKIPHAMQCSQKAIFFKLCIKDSLYARHTDISEAMVNKTHFQNLYSRPGDMSETDNKPINTQ